MSGEGENNGNDDKGGGDSDDGGAAKLVSMTQEELDNLLLGRVAQAQRSWERDLLERLGAKPDDVKTELESLRKERLEAMDEADRKRAEAEQAAAEADRKSQGLNERERAIEVRLALLSADGDNLPVSASHLDDAQLLVSGRMAGGMELADAVKSVRSSNPAMFSSSSEPPGNGQSPPAPGRGAGGKGGSGDDPVTAGKALAADMLSRMNRPKPDSSAT